MTFGSGHSVGLREDDDFPGREEAFHQVKVRRLYQITAGIRKLGDEGYTHILDKMGFQRREGYVPFSFDGYEFAQG